jgi:hypothetical protein
VNRCEENDKSLVGIGDEVPSMLGEERTVLCVAASHAVRLFNVGATLGCTPASKLLDKTQKK